jgi:hypothetical protein
MTIMETKEDAMKVAALKALEYLLSRNMYRGTDREEEFARLSLRMLGELAEDPKAEHFLVENLALHPDLFVKMQARFTLEYMDGGMSASAFADATKKLKDHLNPEIASEREQFESEAISLMSKKGSRLRLLNSDAFSQFEQSLTKGTRLAARRNLARNPETPEDIIEMLKLDPDPETMASALENERKLKEDAACKNPDIPAEELARQVHRRGMTALQYVNRSVMLSQESPEDLATAQKYIKLADELDKMEKKKEGGIPGLHGARRAANRAIDLAREFGFGEVAALIEIEEGRVKDTQVECRSAEVYDAAISINELLLNGDVSLRACGAFTRAYAELLFALSSPGTVGASMLRNAVARAGEFACPENDELLRHYVLLREIALSLMEPPIGAVKDTVRNKGGVSGDDGSGSKEKVH